MSVAIITGSAGLVGSEAAEFFVEKGFTVVGIDNDMRRVFFGDDASTDWNRKRLQDKLKTRYCHEFIDIRETDKIQNLFKKYGSEIKLIIHAAAQPSHDWAVQQPFTDFTINANGTLNLLEATRLFAREAVFIYTSTNKVYGDNPNHLPLVEKSARWDISPSHKYANGILEDMSIDQNMHSLFGVSKTAGDLLVQEYGRYFDLKTVCFRCGCLTGPSHSGTQLHGFLAYLMKCTALSIPYTIFGYKAKQVRDNIHSTDLVKSFYEFYKSPSSGEVYNMGGGKYSNCSILEAIELCETITGRTLDWKYTDQNRLGDHIWWVSGLEKFLNHYPGWKIEYNIQQILQEIHDSNIDRWQDEKN